MFRLNINSKFYISDYQEGDQKDLIEHLREKEIYQQTLAIPFPYTQQDADYWISYNLNLLKELEGASTNWAIRKVTPNQDRDELVGAIGFMNLIVGATHKSEIGYWLAKPYWGQGLMTNAVKVAVNYAFEKLKLIRVTANVFAFNEGSIKVLEKNGFQQEGYLKLHYSKDGQFFDGKTYALLRN